MLLLLSACANGSHASFCALYHPVYMSAADTEPTKRQIDRNNAAWVAVCNNGTLE